MRRRNVVIGLALVAALAVAIPATGADNRLKKALGLSKKADKRSKRALKVAQTSVLRKAQAPASFTTASDDFVAAPDGPRVTVTVPKSGMIEVIARARVGEDAGIVSLFEDGKQVPEQAELCGPGAGALFQSADGAAGIYGTPAAGLGFACAANGAPSAVFFNRAPGKHTYELRYAHACSCADSVFSDRRLWIAPRP